MTFGATLRKYRLDRNMRQADIAGLLGVARNTYMRWEADKNTPRMRYVIDLATIFQCREEDLLHPTA